MLAHFLLIVPGWVQSGPFSRSFPPWNPRKLLLLLCWRGQFSEWRLLTPQPLVCAGGTILTCLRVATCSRRLFHPFLDSKIQISRAEVFAVLRSGGLGLRVDTDRLQVVEFFLICWCLLNKSNNNTVVASTLETCTTASQGSFLATSFRGANPGIRDFRTYESDMVVTG